jgi:hypothetical protein
VHEGTLLDTIIKLIFISTDFSLLFDFIFPYFSPKEIVLYSSFVNLSLSYIPGRKFVLLFFNFMYFCLCGNLLQEIKHLTLNLRLNAEYVECYWITSFGFIFFIKAYLKERRFTGKCSLEFFYVFHPVVYKLSQ